jgi:DNA-directed RNA polymerase subunit RPC12/RpoP
MAKEEFWKGTCHTCGEEVKGWADIEREKPEDRQVEILCPECNSPMMIKRILKV